MFYKSAVFLLGLLGFLKIELVGALTVTEVCLIVLVILTAVEILEMLQYRQVKLVFVTGLIYLGSQIASDLYRDTAVQDFTRGGHASEFF